MALILAQPCMHGHHLIPKEMFYISKESDLINNLLNNAKEMQNYWIFAHIMGEQDLSILIDTFEFMV